MHHRNLHCGLRFKRPHRFWCYRCFHSFQDRWISLVDRRDFRRRDGGSVWVPGRVGDLAYASQTFPNNIEPSIKAAQANGFDPIKTLITSLQSAYSAANKTIRIHAWFPVFADWYAAQIAPQTGTYQAPNPT